MKAVGKGGDSTPDVSVGLAVNHVDVDESRGLFLVDAWMRLGWRDSRLEWDPERHSGLKSVHFAVGEIWSPDVMLYNGYLQ